MSEQSNDNAKRIVILETGRDGGGSFKSLLETLRAVDRERIEPIVFFTSDTPQTESYREAGIEVHIVHDSYYPEDFTCARFNRWFRWRKYCLRKRPFLSETFLRLAHRKVVRQILNKLSGRAVNLVHLNDTPYRNIFGVFLAQKLGCRCTSHIRSTNSGDFNDRILKLCIENIDTYFSVSSDTLNYWLSLGLPADRARVLYNGFRPIETEQMDLREKFGISPKIQQIIAVPAMFIPIKGHHFFLDAFNRSRFRDSIAVLFLGKGSMERQLREKVSALSLSEHVIFTGYQNDLPSILRACDFVVVPSKREPLGRTIIEAALVGAPIIATSSGGTKEILDDRESGWLVEYGNADELAEAIDAFFANPQLARTMAQRALEYVPHRFSIEKNALEFQRSIEDVIGMNR